MLCPPSQRIIVIIMIIIKENDNKRERERAREKLRGDVKMALISRPDLRRYSLSLLDILLPLLLLLFLLFLLVLLLSLFSFDLIWLSCYHSHTKPLKWWSPPALYFSSKYSGISLIVPISSKSANNYHHRQNNCMTLKRKRRSWDLQVKSLKFIKRKQGKHLLVACETYRLNDLE